MSKYMNFSVPTILVKEQVKLRLSNEELLFLIKLLSYNTSNVSYVMFANDFEVNREMMGNLKAKGLVKINENNEGIYIDVTPMYEILYNNDNQIDVENSTDKLSADVLDRISFLLNRQVKSFELDKIREWIKMGHKVEEIEVAIQKSVINNVDNFNYIDTVLQNGHSKNNENDVKVERNIEFY
jgi:DnaD/phage-associated family protein